MLSEQFNNLIYNYKAFLMLLLFIMAQILGWRLWMRLVSQKAARSAVTVVFIVFNLGWAFTVASLYLGRNLTDFTWTWVGRPSVSWQVVYPFAILPLGVAGSLMFRGLRRLKGRGKQTKANEQPDHDPQRRDFLKTAGLTGTALVLGCTGYGVVRQGLPPSIKRLTIKVPGLPAALDGFTIAHLTDVHLGLWASQKELDKTMSLIASEKPQLVAITGDLVDREAKYALMYHEPLKRLTDTPYGVWAVLGNHDHYTNPAQVARFLDGHGLTMLVDRQVNIPDLPLSLIGLDDQGAHQSWMGSGGPSLNKQKDPDVLDFRRVQGPPPRSGDFTILLNHRPEGFAQAARHGCRLYLAGHTHGGQYQLPGADQVNLAALFYKYSSGLYHDHNAWINVSKGLAAVGVPFRFGAWSEVDLITLAI